MGGMALKSTLGLDSPSWWLRGSQAAASMNIPLTNTPSKGGTSTSFSPSITWKSKSIWSIGILYLRA
eukprot:scaffold47583_cov50-Prasinocladus_malaysianus.AAC.2